MILGEKSLISSDFYGHMLICCTINCTIRGPNSFEDVSGKAGMSPKWLVSSCFAPQQLASAMDLGTQRALDLFGTGFFIVLGQCGKLRANG